METDKSTSPKPNLENPEVIYGHRPCQSNKVKWLCLENIYQKLHRDNIYDIGGSYIQDVPDYWFTYKTGQVGTIFLLHIFAVNNQEGTYCIGLSNSNEIHIDKKANIAYLPEIVRHSEVIVQDKKCPVYITTFSFTEADIDFLKGRKLYIALKLNIQPSGMAVTEDIENIMMQHDCRALLTDPVGSDFIIESDDGIKFHVHKILLATHSDVFKAMLKEDTAESQNNCVQLVGVESEAIRAMVEYIYTGTIQDIENINFNDMLMLADRYNLKGMRELCSHALAQQLNLENAIDILVMADMYESHSLKARALKFIKKYKQTLDSITFTQINNVALMRELCNHLA